MPCFSRSVAISATGVSGRSGDDPVRHHIRDLARVRLDVIEGLLLLRAEQREPPGRATQGSRLRTPHQVAFADDADELALGADDRHAADPILEQHIGDFLHGGIRAHGNDAGNHDIGGLHRMPSVRIVDAILSPAWVGLRARHALRWIKARGGRSGFLKTTLRDIVVAAENRSPAEREEEAMKFIIAAAGVAAFATVGTASGAYAQSAGDAAKGRAFAQQICTECHNIEKGQRPSPNGLAPNFETIARTPGLTAIALTAALRTLPPHHAQHHHSRRRSPQRRGLCPEPAIAAQTSPRNIRRGGPAGAC